MHVDWGQSVAVVFCCAHCYLVASRLATFEGVVECIKRRIWNNIRCCVLGRYVCCPLFIHILGSFCVNIIFFCFSAAWDISVCVSACIKGPKGSVCLAALIFEVILHLTHERKHASLRFIPIRAPYLIRYFHTFDDDLCNFSHKIKKHISLCNSWFCTTKYV